MILLDLLCKFKVQYDQMFNNQLIIIYGDSRQGRDRAIRYTSCHFYPYRRLGSIPVGLDFQRIFAGAHSIFFRKIEIIPV